MWLRSLENVSHMDLMSVVFDLAEHLEVQNAVRAKKILLQARNLFPFDFRGTLVRDQVVLKFVSSSAGVELD